MIIIFFFVFLILHVNMFERNTISEILNMLEN